MSSVALVVPFHNEIDRLPLVVRALRRQAPHAVEIVFLDNASDDESLRFVRGLEEVEARKWHCFTEKRVGKFHAMRSATERCEQQLGASILGFLDADSYPANGEWLYQAGRIGVELPDRLGFIPSPCTYYEHEAWPRFSTACAAYHDVISDLSMNVGWFANAAGGFFSLRLLKRYFEIAEPTSEIGLRASLLGLWLGLEGRHNPGTVKTSARRIVRDAVSFTRWYTYSRDFYLCKDINRTRKIDLRHRSPVPDLTPAQVKTFFRRQAVKMSSRILIPMALLVHRSERTQSVSSAIGLQGRCFTEARSESLGISPGMLVTPRFEQLMHRIEHSALCRRTADAVEQLLLDAYETHRRDT
jgi:glycosyltransferase involved in cell wall biosynthesis